MLVASFSSFPSILVTLNPQNAAPYRVKTDNCRGLPFLKEIEKYMISGSISHGFGELFVACFSIVFQ